MRTEIDFLGKAPEFLTERNPFRALRRMEREMDRIYESFFRVPSHGAGALEEIEFSPPCSVEETESHYLLSFDLPGVSRDDLNVEVVGNQLRVSGERNQERREERGSRYLSETQYGCFERSLTLPGEISADKLEANYHDGVLRIAVPKTESAKSQKIPIGEAKPGWMSKFLGKKEEKKAETEKRVKVASA
jgi:HSP20 family protein